MKNRKENALLISIIMVTILLCFSSQAQAAQDGDYAYTVTDGKAQITGYTGVGGNVNIPSTLGGFPLTSIGNYSFLGCMGLTSIVIPQSVTSIGDSAFSNCKGLTNITIPQGVISIGEFAFINCSGLTSITVPQGVTSIEGGTFYGCSGLTSIAIPESVTSIGSSSFYNCSNLTSMTIPQAVTSIGSFSFFRCSKLTSITIPQGVISIERGTFYGCSGLTSIAIPESVTSIGSSSFYNCSNLTSMTIPQEVTSIGDEAFYGCLGLTWIKFNSATTIIIDNAITIPATTKIIGYDPSTAETYAIKHNRTFESLGSEPVPIVAPGDYTYTIMAGKAEITGYTGDGGSITIPDTLGEAIVTSIGNWAFDGWESITSITIPQGVTNIGRSAFEGCTGLTSISVPQGVISIGALAFSSCSNLTSISIPQSVTSIGGQAFSRCSRLTSVTIPQGTTSIGSLDYYGCSCLTSVIIPDSVTSIEQAAFECSGITSIIIPQNVTKIGYYAFSYCSKLKSITFESATTIITDETDTIPAATKIIGYDPSTAKTYATKHNRTFEAIGSTQPITSEYTYTVTDGNAEITGYTGSGGSVTIPSTLGDGFPVTSIGNWAFDGWESITSITIPQGVTNIGRSAFEGCTGLTSISVPQGVISIGALAFSSCSNLTSISIPQSVTSIGGQAFSRCSRLTSVTIPQGTTSIGSLDYYGCSCLTSVIIPDSVTSIEQAAFECSGLTSIIIPQNVTKIGYYAFNGCSKLNSITFKSATTTITDDVDTIPAATKIIGYNPSTAKTYATKHHRTFEAIGPQSINITTPATNLNYIVGDSLDITGLVVTGTYSDGSTKVENVTTTNISGFNSATPAVDQILTITVGDKTIAYKVQIVEKPEDECFIATAAFGSKFVWPVALLRHFRDQYLLTNSLGTAFVNFYYQNSPPIAAAITNSKPLKILVRVLLVPVIAIVYIIYHLMLMGTVLVFFILLLAYRFKLCRKYV